VNSTGTDGSEIERRVPQGRPPASPDVRESLPTLTKPAEESPKPAGEFDRFILSGIIVEGATVFQTSDFVPLYQQRLAQEVGAADLAAIANAITEKYRSAGYFLSLAYIPPHDPETGIVRIEVIEGFIERVLFEGIEQEADIFRRYVAPIEQERPLTLDTLERRLLLLADISGIRVEDARVKVLDADDGRHELTVVLKPKTYDLSTQLDNRGTRANGPWQLWTAPGVNTWGHAAYRAQAGIFTVPNSTQEARYGQLNLMRSLGDDGTSVRMTVSGSRNTAGPPQKDAELQTASERMALGLNHPIIRTRRQSLWTNALLDALHSREEARRLQTFDDNTRVGRLGLYYLVTDGWGGTTGLNIEGSKGISGLGASDRGPERSRSDADGRFKKARVDATRTQAISGPWSAQFQMSAQTTDRPLLSSEEFTLGGARYGRGYDPSTLSGDRAAAGSLELRYGEPIDRPWLSEYQLYGFYDVGVVWNNTSTNGPRDSLASAGSGVRLILQPALRFGAEIAVPLTRTVEGRVEGRAEKDTRLFVTLSADF
jgi:hemolysin activation/secretion protein